MSSNLVGRAIWNVGSLDFTGFSAFLFFNLLPHLLIPSFDLMADLLINYPGLADWTDWRTCISKFGLLVSSAAIAFTSNDGGVSIMGAGAGVIAPPPSPCTIRNNVDVIPNWGYTINK